MLLRVFVLHYVYAVSDVGLLLFSLGAVELVLFFFYFFFCFFLFFFFLFFFQAEDGIRDTSVTGVQTCALPI